MTSATHRALSRHLLRGDGQEDICVALYRPSHGLTRSTALLIKTVLPENGDRRVHGNATITGTYVLRACELAAEIGCGIAILHSHPGASGWQGMSRLDIEAERSYANLAREITGLPLVGLTLAGRDEAWSARHWTLGSGRTIEPAHCVNIRVVGERLDMTWNEQLSPRPPDTDALERTIQSWGRSTQDDLARRRILIVGLGSVGLDLALRLAASGVQHLTLMDFDLTQSRNLDRQIGATIRDVALRRSKVHVARRETRRNATATDFVVDVETWSICEPEGLAIALDHDLIFSCVDRPWPRAVLNALAYTDLIPVIDGGIAIDTFVDGTMRNATWRSHVIRPGRPCMCCNQQLDPTQIAVDIEGLLDDPTYITGSSIDQQPRGQNVATLSVNVTAALLNQYTAMSVAPGGEGEPGPLRYALSTHHIEHLTAESQPHCPFEAAEGDGDTRCVLTGRHEEAERIRRMHQHPGFPVAVRRFFDLR